MTLNPDTADTIASEVMYLAHTGAEHARREPVLNLVNLVRELLMENSERRNGGDLNHAPPPSSTEKLLRRAVLLDRELQL